MKVNIDVTGMTPYEEMGHDARGQYFPFETVSSISTYIFNLP